MNYEKIKSILKEIKKELDNIDDKSTLNSKIVKLLLSEQKNNIETLKQSRKHYNSILHIYSHLINELNLKNSLEVCILYSYLLWNGYFSRTRKNIYTDNDLVSVSGILSYDVMTGKGVCINYSDMLRDFLNENGFESAILINNMDKNLVHNYIPNIHRQMLKLKLISRIKNIFPSALNNKIGDHSFNLVREDGKYYIYDATNLLLLNIKNIHVANAVNGKGKFKLKTYLSYGANLPVESRILLKDFYEIKRFDLPYTRKDFIITCERIVELLDSKKDLLDKYYSLAKNNILLVSDTVDKIKQKKIRL